ncbi:rod shape-determining protein MreC [Flavobacteriaceae bacterium]|nr:rod shape-determining protein MreC [Flavobacteriaceae bacterium]
MHQIISLLQKYRFFLLFLLLESIGLILTLNYHSYQKTKYINASNAFNASINKRIFNFNNYFKLEKNNQILVEDNFRLMQELLNLKNQKDTIIQDTVHRNFKLIQTEIILNQYKNLDNFLIINSGSKQGIQVDMGLINDKGVLGIVNNVSNNYASILSILNSNIKINARLKNSNYFGTISWDGKSYNRVQIEDIPRQATVEIGDTIVTGGRSIIFPDGIPIGKISSLESRDKTYKSIEIELFNDMASLSNAYIIINNDASEILNLENQAREQ